MKQFVTPLLFNREIAQDYYELGFHWPQDVRAPLPGQFITILVEDRISPFLRRPFAVASYDKGSGYTTVIYQKRGPATELLSQKRAEEPLDVLGPRGFPFLTSGEERHILVGGGIGTGPMLFAARWLTGKGFHPTLVLGFRGEALAPRLELAKGTLIYATDDGSLGEKGSVIDVLGRHYPDSTIEEAPATVVWACGPHGMLYAAHRWAQSRNWKCQVLMEQVMACAVGACNGCTIETTDERQMARVCTEGPVFPSEAVKWI